MVAQAVRVAMGQVVLGVQEDQGVQAREAMAPTDPVDQEVRTQMDHQETHQMDQEQADHQVDRQVDHQEVDPPG